MRAGETERMPLRVGYEHHDRPRNEVLIARTEVLQCVEPSVLIPQMKVAKVAVPPEQDWYVVSAERAKRNPAPARAHILLR